MKHVTTVLLLSACALAFTPGCIKRKKTEHTAQMDARQLYDSIRYEYEEEIKLVYQVNQAIDDREEHRLERKLRAEILLRNEQYNKEHREQWFTSRWMHGNKHENYPFIQYKEVLDSKIHEIEKELQGLYWKNEGIGSLLRRLIKDLDALKRYIVTSKEYQQERHLYEELKIKQQELEFKKKQEQAKERAERLAKKKKKKATKKQPSSF